MHHQKQKQEKYKELIEEFYTVETVHENCLFACLATVFDDDGFMFGEDVAFDAQNLRSLVADEIVRLQGKLPHWPIEHINLAKVAKHVLYPTIVCIVW